MRVPAPSGLPIEPPTTLEEALVRLADAEDTMRAIRAGEVDAFVVSERADHPSVVSLTATDRPYRAFVENMSEGAATISTDGVVLFANRRLAELLQRTKKSLLGVAAQTFIVGGLPTGWNEPAARIPGGRGVTLDLDLIAASGELVPVLVRAAPLELDGQHFTCLTFTDQALQLAHEREVERLHHAQVADELRFAAVVEAMHEGVLVQDRDGGVLEANRMASEILGVPPDRLVTEPPTPLPWLIPHRDRTGAGASGTSTSGLPADGDAQLGVLVGVDRGDDHRWLEINSVPLQFPGETQAPVVISSFRDVTARVVADQAIRFQALLLDTAGQAIIAVGADGLVLYWNGYAERMYGYDAIDAIGRPISELIQPADGDGLTSGAVTELASGESLGSDHWVTRRDGTRFPVFATITPVVDEEGTPVGMITVSTDITERKRAEDQARQLSAIIESSSDAVISVSLELVVTTWNPGATAVFGYEEDEAVGACLSMLEPSEEYHRLARTVIAEGVSLTDVEIDGVTRDGHLVHVSVSISPISDEDGETIGVSVIARDVTERVGLEEVAAESRHELDQVRHTAELEAIGRQEADRANRAKSEFLSRMSHELRTPLNAVLGFGQILMMDDLTEDQRENVEYIQRAGEHLLDLINDVLDISRIEAGALRISLEDVHLNEVVVNALTLIRPQAFNAGIALINRIEDEDELHVRADRQRLLQVLLNLLSNAVKYNRPSGQIEVTCESSGGTVSVAVSDTGFGIFESDLAKLFTPFERLGAEDSNIEGTGVGLALSRALSQQMGGSLTVFSEPGVGTTFTIEMPSGTPEVLLAPEACAVPEPRTEPATPSRTVTVLAIEDNVANIRLLEQAMRRCENVVLLTAIQGRLGLDLAVQNQPDLILLDLHLPDLPGEAVLQQLRLDPATAGIPVVVCSADASPTQPQQMIDLGATAYFTKPYKLIELYELIEQARAR